MLLSTARIITLIIAKITKIFCEGLDGYDADGLKSHNGMRRKN
jgi:hypothetical protein